MKLQLNYEIAVNQNQIEVALLIFFRLLTIRSLLHSRSNETREKIEKSFPSLHTGPYCFSLLKSQKDKLVRTTSEKL